MPYDSDIVRWLGIGANYGCGVRRLAITMSPLVRKQKRGFAGTRWTELTEIQCALKRAKKHTTVAYIRLPWLANPQTKCVR